MTARKGPAGIAELLRELELRQPAVVTKSQLREWLDLIDSHLSPEAAADRLVREGWFNSIRTRDAWEFIPAARAGRVPSGDPWIELRAHLRHHPDAPVALAFAAAFWFLGFSSHPPDRQVLVVGDVWRKPRSLKGISAARFDWRLPTQVLKGLPVVHPATAVVATAHLPRFQSNWGNADDWLPEAMRATTPDEIVTESKLRRTTTIIRLSYFAEWSGRHDIVDALSPDLPDDLPVTYLGPRTGRGRWVNRWRLIDSLLPNR